MKKDVVPHLYPSQLMSLFLKGGSSNPIVVPSYILKMHFDCNLSLANENPPLRIKSCFSLKFKKNKQKKTKNRQITILFFL